jgi:hypothetical protein
MTEIKLGQHYWCEINLKFSPTWEEPFRGSVRVLRKMGEFWVVKSIAGSGMEFFVNACHLHHLPELPVPTLR